jgi:hypothetical protein
MSLISLKWDGQAWQETRKRGEFRYLVLEGILPFGGLMFLLNILVEADGQKFDWSYFAFSAAWCILGGAFIGDWNWRSNEKRFKMDRAGEAVAAEK